MAYREIIVGLRICQFREFEMPPSACSYNFVAFSFVHKLTCGKRENVSWQLLHSMKNRRAVRLLNPLHAIKNEGKNRGGERDGKPIGI